MRALVRRNRDALDLVLTIGARDSSWISSKKVRRDVKLAGSCPLIDSNCCPRATANCDGHHVLHDSRILGDLALDSHECHDVDIVPLICPGVYSDFIGGYGQSRMEQRDYIVL